MCSLKNEMEYCFREAFSSRTPKSYHSPFLKIYTADRNFTQPAIPPVAPNISSGLETFVLIFQFEDFKFCAHSDINVEVKEALKQPCSRLTRSMLNPIFIPCRRQDDDDDHDDQDGICALCSDAFLYALVSHFVLLHIFTLI